MNPQNVEALKRWPAVLAALESAPDIQCVLSATPQQTLVIDGVFLTSGYSRLREAQQQASMIVDGHKDGWVYGIGLGELPATMLGRVKQVNVVIMNRAIAKASLSAVRHSWLEDPRVTVHLAGTLPDAFGPFTLNPVELRMADADAYHVRDRLQVLLNVEINDKCHAARKVIEDANEAGNAEAINSDIHVQMLFGASMRDAIVCMGGPTLANYYDWIRERKDTHVIIAASTVLYPLMEQGIVPDYVCVMDSSPAMIKHFMVMPSSGSALVYSPVVNPRIVSGWRGPRYYARIFVDADGKGEAADLYPGGSVLFMGVDLARKMGARTVTLIGADLCFPGAKSHVEGAQLANDVTQAWRQMTVNGRGEKVATEDALSQYRLGLEAYVADHADVEWIKMGRDGVDVRGMAWGSE